MCNKMVWSVFCQVVNLLEFFAHHMTDLSVYMCLDLQFSYNFERRKTATCVFL